MRRVVCIEGVHGSGKTTLCSHIKQQASISGNNNKFKVLDEAFIHSFPCTSKAIHPQSLISETYWTACWFQRILNTAVGADVDQQQQQQPLRSPQQSDDHSPSKSGSSTKHPVIIVDRSPYSAVFYTRNNRGRHLSDMIQHSIEELKECNIELTTVYLKVPDVNVVWDRIQSRMDENRLQLNEANKDHLNHIYDMYDREYSHLWDFTVDVSKFDYDCDKIIKHLQVNNIL